MSKASKREIFPAYFTNNLADSARIIDLEKDEYLFRTGGRTEGIYFVLKGEMKALRPMLKEGEAIMVRAAAGEFFAESAIAARYYSCDAICVKTATLAFLSISSLSDALEDSPFAKAFFLANATNARRQCSRYERVRLRSARDRVLHLLTCESGPDGIFIWPAPLTELASELALEPETLYRVLSDLDNEGLIRREKRQFQLIS